MIRCETCKQGRETFAVDTKKEIAAPVGHEEPALDDQEERDCELIADHLMRSEMRSLRKTLTTMKRDHETQEHSHTVAKTVMEVNEQQLDSLHRNQEQLLQHQELALQDASATISSLETKIELLEGTSRDMNAQLHRLQKLQLYQQTGESAEVEILRRQLDTLTKQLQTKLTAFTQEQELVVNLQARLVSKEHELRSLRSEICKKMPVLNDVHVSLPSPPRVPQTRPVTAVDFKTRVAEPKYLNAGMNNIQNWWSGMADESPPRNQEESAAYPSPIAGTRTMSCGDKISRDLVPSAENTARRGCNSATSSSRPFRARLVGLLNSLEEETTAYKELVVETKERAVSRRGHRQLPCLDV